MIRVAFPDDRLVHWSHEYSVYTACMCLKYSRTRPDCERVPDAPTCLECIAVVEC